MQNIFTRLLFISLFCAPLVVLSQNIQKQSFTETLNWQNTTSYDENTEISHITLYFDGSGNEMPTMTLPVFRKLIPVTADNPEVSASIKNIVLDELRLNYINDYKLISDNFNFQYSFIYARGQKYACISFVPVRRNNLSGFAEYLLKFTLEVTVNELPGQKSSAFVKEPITSVLSQGTWYKLKISNTGIHKINATELSSIGISTNGIDPRNIRIFGNGGGMLPEANKNFRYNDLKENAIVVAGEEDGRFDAGDYILFYATGPDTWNYDQVNDRFAHTKNVYDDYAYYFITTGTEKGKRIVQATIPDAAANKSVNTYRDFTFHETDNVNLIKSGRQFYGELFDIQTDYNYNVTIQNRVPGTRIKMATAAAAKAYKSSKMSISNNGSILFNQSFTALPPTSLETQYANRSFDTLSFDPASDILSLKYSYSKPLASAQAWLDYFELEYTRSLSFTGPQTQFRNPSVTGAGNITAFTLNQAGSGIQIWDVTAKTEPKIVQTTVNGNSLIFKALTDTLREFVAFNGSGFNTVEPAGQVSNQNLHGLTGTNYIIITHPDFLSQAQQIADFHSQTKNLSVSVVTPIQVYNEFSSGAQDVTAIRDFMSYLYNNTSSPNSLKYLLLLGDASYDYKSRILANTNFIPTFQSVESLHPVFSFATDDYFGQLDGSEGAGAAGAVDIGIGRIPVSTVEQAEAHINKIASYTEKSAEAMQDWRNIICFVADDQDNNSHMHQADGMARLIDSTNQQFNVDKIYFDSYQQVSTPGGQRYPDVTTAINQRVEKGTLIMNYTGHGGELGWAHERVLELSDINGWQNIKNLPLFITATCEFSRYDDPERVSAGERVFLNPVGGSIAMFTTSRLTYGGSNLTLNKSFLKWAMLRQDNKYMPLGDIVRLAKSESGTDINGKKFIFLGDPALELAHPSNMINTLTINGNPSRTTADTLKALSSATITGEITDPVGNRLTDFNGTVYPVVFDKASSVATKGNDHDSYVEEFKLQKNIVYKGQTEVKNGLFSFSFIVPKDIEYRYGEGKISYYAQNGLTDASGFYKDIVIGGIDENNTADSVVPEIKLYINNENFVNGGLTGENPVLYARLFDESGINTVGNGIGHDLLAVLDDNTRDPKILNDFYKADFGTYTSGVISYPMTDLSNGPHSVKLTVWDVYNNSASQTINFVVENGETLAINNLMNYPNPFSISTNFVFEHNQAADNLNATISIYNLTGQLVKTISKKIDFNGYRIDPLPWDGTNESGKKLSQGFYIYRLVLSEGNEKSAEKSGRLVITNTEN